MTIFTSLRYYKFTNFVTPCYQKISPCKIQKGKVFSRVEQTCISTNPSSDFFSGWYLTDELLLPSAALRLGIIQPDDTFTMSAAKSYDKSMTSTN